MPKYEYQEIELEKLEFDKKNYRIFLGKDQDDTFNLLVEKENMNLVDMAKDIAANGLSPIDISAVVKKDREDKYTVIEGNRRLAAIRLLEKPSLAKNSQITNALVLLSQEYQENPIKKVLCVVMPDKETAMQWVDRKQGTGMGGAGLRRADYVQNAVRKAARGEYEKWYASVEYLRKNGFLEKGGVPEREIDRQGTGAAIERVFGTAYLSDKLGINISSNGDVKFENNNDIEGAKLLFSILTHLIERNLSTDDVRTLTEREEILQTFLDQNVKQTISQSSQNSSPLHTMIGENEESAEETEIISEAQETTDKKDKESNQKLKIRTKLAPGNLKYAPKINNQRIKRLLIEIQKLNVSDTTHGRPLIAGVVMRVFLDLSITHFLIESNTTPHSNLKTWDSYRARLPQKLGAALKVIDPTNSNRKLDNVRTALSKDFHHSIHRLNEQIHALGAPILTHRECIEYWDRYAPLFDAIFGHLSEND